MFDEAIFKEIGIHEFGFITPNQIVFGDEIRAICESNGCRLYGSTWACPPAVGTIGDCRKRCMSYGTGMVFSSKYPLEDSFDIEGMDLGHKQFKEVCDRLYSLIKEKKCDFLLLSNEGCIRCANCTYPESACRFPDMLFPSVEGFGIYVNKLAESAGIQYINGKNTVTYIGMLLF